MKIVHISTFERGGGAAIAAGRLHLALRKLGHDSTMLVQLRSFEDLTSGVVCIPAAAPALSSPVLEQSLASFYANERVPGCDVLFSTDLPTRDLSDLPFVREADVVNVHWTSGTLSTAALQRLQEIGKPVVWTLHDQGAFTGGCHYSSDCDGYVTGCAACPAMKPGFSNLPAAVFRNKQRWLDARRLDVVTPSNWLADVARKSLLLRDARVLTIPNGLPVSLYQRIDRTEARKRLALPADAVVVLLGSDRLDEQRKGHAHLAAALDRLEADPAIADRLARRTLVLAAFGEGHVVQDGMPILRLGRLVGDERLATAYRAADLFVLPTLQDNLPNTLLESLAAGTPVAAYATGGIPDVVEHGRHGALAATGDIAGLADGIESLIFDDARRESMRSACEALARERFELDVLGRAYLEVYEASIARHASEPAKVDDDLTFAERVAEREARLFDEILASPGVGRAVVELLTKRIDVHAATIAQRDRELLERSWYVQWLERSRAEDAATLGQLREALGAGHPSA